MVLTFVMSFIVMLLVIVGMSLGVLNGRRAISGSCGGLNGGRCELCSNSCEKQRRKENSHD